MAKKAATTHTEDAPSRTGKKPLYELRLYIAGLTPQSQRAIKNVQTVCQEHLAGRYDLKIIDIYQQPVLAKDEQIVAVPTLIRRLPEPLRKLIGSMADAKRLLLGLDLRHK